MQSYSNIQINDILIKGKQDTEAEICVMPVNIFNQLNSKLNGELKLCSCNDVQVMGTANIWSKLLEKLQLIVHMLTPLNIVFFMLLT